MAGSATGGRADSTKSTAVWRCHQRNQPKSHSKCFRCRTRTKVRLRKDGDIRPLCTAHFAEETGYPETNIKKALNDPPLERLE